ncbi:MAG TPA: YihY/virulence factor BrkB family protein [Terriglobales bacterium]|nr:YihY/virulence factor BrkB family protein [Terriglobales bacterium]
MTHTLRHRLREQWHLLRETGKLLGPSARLLTTTETHTFAYSVSANFLLASLPFLFLLLWVSNQLLPSLGATQQAVIGHLVASYLPAGQDRLVADATRLAHRHTVQVFSFVMLAISSSGVFLPLEVALNSIWGFKKNRGYVGNQVISLALVLGCGVIAYASVVLASLGAALAAFIFPANWTLLIGGINAICLTVCSVPAAIGVFFLIYWKLPNGKVPASQVFPAALYTGLLAEVFKTVFPLVLPYLDFNTVYATLALPVTLLVWGYCGALLLLFGASLSARGVARLPALHIKLPRYSELRAWYSSHGHRPEAEIAVAAAKKG